MAHTFTQIYIHCVWAVSRRQPLIQSDIEEDVYRYISGIVKEKKQKLISINGMADHIHMAIGIKPTCCISDLIGEIKKSSNTFIRRLSGQRNFNWQEGFAAFSVSHRSLSNLVLYIQNQKQHHLKRTYAEEFNELLIKYNLHNKSDVID